MKWGWLGLPVLAAGIGVAVWQTGGDAQAGLLPWDDPAQVALGAEIYAENCASCHGAALEGEPDWRQRDSEGYLPAPPHDASGHTWHHPDEQLITITTFGTEAVVGGGYRSRMPGFSGALTEDEILAVLAYIKSTWPPEVIARHNQINEGS